MTPDTHSGIEYLERQKLDQQMNGCETDDEPEQFTPETLSFSKFRTRYPKLRPPVIEGIVREGETINVISAAKVGKSWLSLDLAMSVALGKRWLGLFATSPGPVLVVDNELEPQTLSSRLETVRDAHDYSVDDLDKSFDAVSLRGKNFTIYELAAWLKKTVECGQYRLIVLDAFYRFLPPGTSENDNAGMMQLYNTLDVVADQLGCSFVLIHHSSKGAQGSKSVTDVGSGAGSISRAADGHLVIRPHEDESYSVLETAVRSFPPMDPQTVYFEFPKWLPSDLEPKVKTIQSAAARARTESDNSDIDELCKSFKDQTFTAYKVRSALGGGQGRADRIVRVACKAARFEKAGTTKNKSGNKVPQYRVKP